MEEKKRRSDRVEAVIPIRVRGMSTQNKFFDEEAETNFVSEHSVMTRLRNLVELETEVHVTNLKNNVGGTFRVTWVNTRVQDGFHAVGLEVLEPEGDLWEIHFQPAQPEDNGMTAQAWLACQRCHQKLLTAVPEAEYEFLCDGFLVARPCDRCKATTSWEFTGAEEPAVPAPEPVQAGPETPDAPTEAVKTPREDLRVKGRAPIQMQIKVIRQKYGTILEDVCQTENVSRTGAYFVSSQNYDKGELVKVILPYKEGDLAIPVPARVVRQDQPKGSFYHAVAIHLEAGE